MLQSHIFDELSLQDQLELQRIFAGIDLPPLYSDVIAKSVFGADVHPDRLQKWLAMIADTNDPDAASAAADDETLARIRIEINNMAQDKEVQNMLMQERFERMDWESYGEEREEKGRAEERINTERERARADAAEEEVRKLRKLLEELKNKNT